MALMFTFLWKNDSDVSEYEITYGKMDNDKLKELMMTQVETGRPF